MGNRFILIEETASSFTDVANEVKKLAERLGAYHSAREAKQQLLQVLRRPDIVKVLGETRVNYIWNDAKNLDSVESIQTLLQNMGRYMEKEGAAEISWENMEKALADMLGAQQPDEDQDKTSLAPHSPPQGSVSTSSLTTWRSPDGVKYSVKKNSETGEWMVAAYVNGKFDDGKTYYASDKDDAVGTLNHMKKSAQKTEGDFARDGADVRSGADPRTPPVESHDPELRWADMNAQEREALLKKAGFGSMSAEMAKAPWGAFKSDEKKDIEWVLKADPSHLGENTFQDPDDYLAYKGDKIQKGTRVVLDLHGMEKKATVKSIGTEDNEPVLDYIADDGRKGWAYLDQVIRIIPKKEEEETLEAALNAITASLVKYGLPKDKATIVSMKLRERAPYIAEMDVLTILMDAGVSDEEHAEEMAQEVYAILEKFGAVRAENESVLGPQIPFGAATSGGASYHGGGLDEMQGALAKGDEVEAVHGTYRGLKGLVLRPGKMVEVSVSAPWEGTVHGASMKLTPRQTIHIRESELRTMEAFPGQIPVTGVVDDVRPPSIDPRSKKVLNKYLSEISGKYWDDIPVREIAEEFRKQGLEIEDLKRDPAGTENLGNDVAGKTGRETSTIRKGGEDVKNAKFILSWYVMPSGKYEVTAYVS